MNKILLLASDFTRHFEEEKQADLVKILGLDMEVYVEEACLEAEFTLISSFSGQENKEPILVLSDATPGIYSDDIIEFKEDDAKAFYNTKGQLIAFKTTDSELAELEGKSFEEAAAFLGQQIYLSDDDEEIEDLYEITYVEDFISFSKAVKEIRFLLASYWMLEGVRIDHPELVTIEPTASIGKGTWLMGNVEIIGSTVIGENCLINDNSKIVDSTIGNHVVIKNSLIESSIMEDDTDIGPYSHLRPKAQIKKGAHIGNFVEVKNAVMGEGAKAGHLAYIGDADVGANVNIGCGVIFVNYDGKKKHRTSVGDNAFIGSNANLVAPVVVQEEAYVAAGSTITKTVEKGSLALERAEQKCISGYVDKKKKQGLL